MKNIPHNTLTLLILCVAFGSMSAPASAAPGGATPGGSVQGTGAITGRVRNVVTNEYLNNARVSIRGTNQMVYTDNFGNFQLVGVPGGPLVLEVFYTGLDPAQIPLAVRPGETIDQAVDLTSVDRYGPDATTVKLDAFVVNTDRETDAQAIAINEQRFAPNIKTVMSTDALGDVLGNAAGEFLKYMPGVTVEYDGRDISTISVRGIGGGKTAVEVDGVPGSSTWVPTTRQTDLRAMSLNDITRVEVTKAPTPATPADSLGGHVNMVSKSAFERSGRQLRLELSLVGNQHNLTLKKTPDSHLDRNTYKVLPGLSFDFVWPVAKTFGVVIAGMHTNMFHEQNIMTTGWGNSGTGTNAASASPSNPILNGISLQDGPRSILRDTLSIKADWKVMRHSVLSLGHTINRATTRIGTLIFGFNTGTNGTPNPATGVPMTWGPTFTFGATGRGTFANTGTNQLLNQKTDTTNLAYRFDDGRWKIDASVGRSASALKRRFEDAGFFFQAASTANRPVRVNYLDFRDSYPHHIEGFDNANLPFEWRDISNFMGTTANNMTSFKRGENRLARLNIRRRFELFSFPTALQVGGSHRTQMLDTAHENINWTFNGPNGNSGATAPLAPYAMQVYKNMDSGYGFRDIQWMSPARAWQAYLLDPRLYSKTAAQQFAELNYRYDNSEHIEETVQAAYVQAEAHFFHNRLHVLTGVRFEKTTDEGQGALTDADAVWQRDANGNYIRTASGARIRKPEAGPVNSVAQVLLTRKMRGAFSDRSYDGYYPSLHLTYNASENVLVRGAYARSYGRPNFTDIIPRVVTTAADLDADDPDPATGRGTVTLRNPGLEPWTADNFDLSLEYYTSQGGVFSAGVFLKEIRDFFGDSSVIATEAHLAALGLDSSYLGWNIQSTFNSGNARIKGAEINIKQSLRSLGRWGSYFTLFVDATKLELEGNQGASFTSFIPESGNGGVLFSWKRISATARWNYRGLDRRVPQAAFGPDGYQYLAARTTLDMTASYQLARKLALVTSINNLTNEPLRYLRYGAATPGYARQYQQWDFGAQIAVGIKGTF